MLLRLLCSENCDVIVLLLNKSVCIKICLLENVARIKSGKILSRFVPKKKLVQIEVREVLFLCLCHIFCQKKNICVFTFQCKLNWDRRIVYGNLMIV